MSGQTFTHTCQAFPNQTESGCYLPLGIMPLDLRALLQNANKAGRMHEWQTSKKAENYWLSPLLFDAPRNSLFVNAFHEGNLFKISRRKGHRLCQSKTLDELKREN